MEDDIPISPLPRHSSGRRSVSAQSSSSSASEPRARGLSQATLAPYKKTTYQVPVPEGGCEGDVISIELPAGDVARLTLPLGIAPGEILEFVWPPDPEPSTPSSRGSRTSGGSRRRSSVASSSKDGLFEIEVPEDARPGEIIRILVPHLGGKMLDITMPEGVEPGMKLAFYPPSRTHEEQDPASSGGSIQDGTPQDIAIDMVPSAEDDDSRTASWTKWFSVRRVPNDGSPPSSISPSRAASGGSVILVGAKINDDL